MNLVKKINSILKKQDPCEDLSKLIEDPLVLKNIPELIDLVKFKTRNRSKNLWKHVCEVVLNIDEGDLTLRWAALFHDIGKPATVKEKGFRVSFFNHDIVGSKMWELIGERLDLENNFVSDVSFLIRNHLMFSQLAAADERISITDSAIRRFIRKCDGKFEQLYVLSMADISTKMEWKYKKITSRCSSLKSRIDAMIKLQKIKELKLPKGTGTLIEKELGLTGRKLGDIMNLLRSGLKLGIIDVNDNLIEVARTFKNQNYE